MDAIERATERQLTLACRWPDFRAWVEQQKRCRWENGRLSFELSRPAIAVVGSCYWGAWATVEIIPEPVGGHLKLTVRLTETADSYGYFDEEAARRFDDFVSEMVLQFDKPEGDGTQPTAGGAPARAKRGGAPQVTDRLDWDMKLEAVRRIQRRIEAGTTVLAACELEGMAYSTYRRLMRKVNCQ